MLNPIDLAGLIYASYHIAKSIPVKRHPGNGAIDLHPGERELSFGECMRCKTCWKYDDPYPVSIEGELEIQALCEPCWKYLQPLDRVVVCIRYMREREKMQPKRYGWHEGHVIKAVMELKSNRSSNTDDDEDDEWEESPAITYRTLPSVIRSRNKRRHRPRCARRTRTEST